MRRTQKATTSQKQAGDREITESNQPASSRDLHRLEFHRHGFALAPDPKDSRLEVAFLRKGGRKDLDRSFCSCTTSRKKTCPHILELSDFYRAFHKKLKGRTPDDDFRSSLWYRLARDLAEGCKETAHSLKNRFTDRNIFYTINHCRF